MQIDLNGKTIYVIITRKKNKNIYMRFQDSNHLVVTANPFVSEKEIKKILEKNRKSLEKMQLRSEKEAEEAKYFLYLGKKYQKRFDGITKNPYFDGEYFIAKDENTLEKFQKKECKRIFEIELKRILEYFPPVPFFTLKIRNMKTRWGVNNQSSKTITLNSELIKKDFDLIDYVIIHELCHFKEPNHSSRFWAYVEEYFPKYKEARRRLRG